MKWQNKKIQNDLSMVDFSWGLETLLFVVAVGWSAVGFSIYYFLSRNSAIPAKYWKAHPKLNPQAKEIVLQRVWGFIFLGIIPVFFILLFPDLSLKEFGMGCSWLTSPPWWVIGILIVILIAGYYSAKQPGNLEMYPQIRNRQWTPGLLTLSGLSWVVFLLGYEFLFRGFLLYASLAVMDVWPAIALNCALYAFAHLYKGPGETFGAIPLGILLCYLTLLTGNIWTAVGIHSVMALSNEWWSIRANKHMIIKKSGR
jgi:membrane protease YdiL (CAAX protease family)